MEITLVSLLILAFLSGGQSLVRVTEQTNTCHKSCPPGYYNIGMCSNPGTYKCKKCDKNTYTERENYITKCLRCSNCELNEVAIKNCTSTQNVVCACKEGYYYSEYNPRLCEPCENAQLSNPNYTKVCQPPCQRKECLSNTKCRMACQPSTTPFTTTTTTTTETASTKKNPNMTKVQHKWTYFLWLFLCIVVAIFMTLSGLWLLFLFVNQPGNSCSLPFCSEKKDIEPHAEDLELNEEHSQRCSAPATLTFHISEETPIMSDCLSPPTLQQPVHISLIQKNAEHKAARQGEQSEHWPAIVLYTIIKEVPLRRWKEFLRLLSVADQELERVEMEAGFGLGSIERQYQMLRLWSQRSSASLNDVFSALHYMDLSGCAQLLQENLENLQWRPEPKQFPTV